jgi:hypothetical protein
VETQFAVMAAKLPTQSPRGTRLPNAILMAVENIYHYQQPNAPRDPLYLMAEVEAAWEFYQVVSADAEVPKAA